MEIDEFTFPTTHPNNSPIDSPPLWRLSPTASPTPSYEHRAKEGDQIDNRYVRRSCSFLEGRCLMKRSKMSGNNTNVVDDHDQEKMDMLWEDLNYEELFKNGKNDPRSKVELRGKFTKGSNDMAEYGCVPTPFKLVRTNNMKGGSSKKTSLLVLVKVLKRLFVLQQSAKKRPY